MSAEEILLDAEERMEKALAKLKQRPGRHPHRPGQSGPGRFAARRGLRLAHADQGDRLGRSPRADADRHPALRPGTLKDIEKAIQASGLGFNPQNDGRLIRINVPPLSTEVRRKLVGADQGAGRRGQGRHSQRPPRRQQSGRPGAERQNADRGRARPGQGRDPGSDQEVRGFGDRSGRRQRKRSHGGLT